MLDLFTIFSKSGIVLWYFQGTADLLTNSVNELIKSVILQERGLTSAWNHNTLSMQYKLDNEFELVFVVAYQNIIKLAYVDKFLSEIQLRFRDKYKHEIQKGHLNHDFSAFKSDFDDILKDCEHESRSSVQAQSQKVPRSYKESDKSTRTVASMIETKKPTFMSNLINSATGVVPSKPTKKETENLMRTNEEENGVDADSGCEAGNDTKESVSFGEVNGTVRKVGGKPKFVPKKKTSNPSSPKAPEKPKGKKMTTWEGAGEKGPLDYSAKDNDKTDELTSRIDDLINRTSINQYVNKEVVNTFRGDLKPIEIEEEDTVESEEEEEIQVKTTKKTAVNGKKNAQKPAGPEKTKSSGGIFSSLKSLVGAKVLTKEAIEPVMLKMQDHLISKNVAVEIAQKVCENVAQNLEGKQLGSFQFVTSIVKQALNDSMVQILTPKKRVDILRDVYEAQRQKRPYTIVFCGVNGVGKSTNLAKVTFWLIENSFRVLIAACDTFRSGAVEQLRTHSRHLNALHPAESHGGKQMVELFEKGYGKDPAAIAHDAISYARDNQIDVVLVDTAGRMQDNQPLMISLAKLININMPDLVLFVGEALVGNEAVDQVTKFNQALIDNSPMKTTNPENVRTIDGIVLTKFDTIDDKVGAAISMTYTTGQPIVFVGTGQTYSDLKSLNAQSVVQSLLK